MRGVKEKMITKDQILEWKTGTDERVSSFFAVPA